MTEDVGLIVQPDDEEGFADALVKMRTATFDPEAIRAYAIARYGYSAVGSQLKELFSTVQAQPAVSGEWR